jgi:signal transduction histidine kinase/DNA-binding response OmpR family regulator/streptogramin lyase
MINGIQQDSSGYLWLSTMKDGIYKMDPFKDSFQKIIYKYKEQNTEQINLIRQILMSKSGNLYIGTIENGLFLLNTKNNYLKRIDIDPGSGENVNVSSLFEDKKGTLWLGTMNNGLYSIQFINDHINQLHHFKYNPSDINSLSYNQICDIMRPIIVDTNSVWIATGNGLNRLNLNSKTFTHYFEKDAIPDNYVLKVLEDDHGNIWIACANGIGRYDLSIGKWKNYGMGDGLPFETFGGCRQNATKAKDGKLFFSGGSGTIGFYPDQIIDNPLIPPVHLTNFKIFHQSIKLDSSLQFKKSITLTHDQNTFSFEFSALNYTNTEKNQYKYKLEGFNNDWIFCKNERFAHFTNLDPRNYIFRVKGSNNHGIWNEQGTSIRLIVLPPWWRTNIAYTFYIFCIGFLIWGIWNFQVKKLKMKQQLELEHLNAEKLEEINKIKSNFFANISHEFRTPLTLILNPVKQILSGEFKGNFKEQYKSIIRNAERLLNLINQLLDLSKLESGKLKLQAQSVELVSLTNSMVQAFESLAKGNDISLLFKSLVKSQEVFIDVDKFEKIINNLLSNAFKFTPQGGLVEVELLHPTVSPLDMGNSFNSPLQKGDKGGCLQISISNTGSGIPTDRIHKIFDRFYQVDNSYTKDGEGTGIGLALTKELVELHHGEIKVESIKVGEQSTGEHPPGLLNKGEAKTTFTVLLPLGKKHLKVEEILDNREQIKSPSKKGVRRLSKIPVEITTSRDHQPISKRPYPSPGLQSPMILVVEDNADLRHYIISNIEHEYNILEAENGEDGWDQATREIPDLVISDVMMPEMDGIELCKRLKTDQRTSHIPVILLTARAAKEDKIEGLETGADDFIPKPFDSDELKIRIKNLIIQRKKLREQFSTESKLAFDKIAYTPADEKFIKQTLEIILQHISDSEFNVQVLSNEVGMSQMHLYRKIKGQFGQSPAEFVKTIRLKRGAELLRNKTGNISEIAYEVGFENPAYFSSCFRQQFGISPSAFVKNQKFA